VQEEKRKRKRRKEEELAELRSIEVRASPLHGRGVFATRRIRAGAHIGAFEGKPTRRDGTHVLWVAAPNGGEIGIRGENDLRFLNHSQQPNAEFDGADLVATRNIQPCCEVTIHYGDAWEGIG
jgi:SET domain-containing protein